MFDGIGRTVLAVSNLDFVQVAEASENQNLGGLNEDFGIEAVHDLMAEFH